MTQRFTKRHIGYERFYEKGGLSALLKFETRSRKIKKDR
jgi:hypothetical protein